MATATTQSTARRTRITIDLPPELRRGVRVAAAQRDVSMTRYVTEVLQRHLASGDGRDAGCGAGRRGQDGSPTEGT